MTKPTIPSPFNTINSSKSVSFICYQDDFCISTFILHKHLFKTFSTAQRISIAAGRAWTSSFSLTPAICLVTVVSIVSIYHCFCYQDDFCISTFILHKHPTPFSTAKNQYLGSGCSSKTSQLGNRDHRQISAVVWPLFRKQTPYIQR